MGPCQSRTNMPALADEIARLSKENSELRGEIARTRSDSTIQGLSFFEVEEILRQRGLLSVFEGLRQQLGSPLGVSGNESQLSDLCVIGLLNTKGFGTYELFDAGRMFLNRLQARKLINQNKV